MDQNRSEFCSELQEACDSAFGLRGNVTVWEATDDSLSADDWYFETVSLDEYAA